MFVQRHPQRSCYHHNQQQSQNHHLPRSRYKAGTSIQKQSSNQEKLPKTFISPSNKRCSDSKRGPLALTTNKQFNSTFKVKSKSYNWLAPNIITLNSVKLKRSESLPSRLAISLVDLEETKKRLSCDPVLLSLLGKRCQSTGAEHCAKTEFTSLDCLETGAVREGSSPSPEHSKQGAGFVSNSLKNVWSFSHFWFDFVAYQIQTWRLIAEDTLPTKKHVTDNLVGPECVDSDSHNTYLAGPVPVCVNEISHSSANQTTNAMSFNDYYLVSNYKRPIEYPASGWDKTLVDTQMRPRSRMGARNPLYRNLSLNVEVTEPRSYYPTTDYYTQHSPRPHSSRAEYPLGNTTEPSSGRSVLNYHHRFYQQHFSADSITNGIINNKAYLAKQLYSPQLAPRQPTKPFHISNHLSVADSDGYGGLQISSTSPTTRPHKAPRLLSPVTMNSCEYHSSALNSLDYSTGGDEPQRSLPITKVELCSRQPEAMDERHMYLRRMQYQRRAQPTTLRQHHCERPNSSMSYQRTYSEATDPRTIARQVADRVGGGPRIRSDSDLARNRPQEGNNGNTLCLKADERFYHIHTATQNRSHEKVKSSHSSGSNPSNQPPTEAPKSNRSPQQLSGPRKPNSSSLKLSLTGAKKRLGFKQSGSTALRVQRSEEILPSEHNNFLSHQLDTCSPSSSCDTNHSFFIEGLGPGQIVSRQGLVSPYLGDIQLTLTDRRGMLEVEVVRARRLQMKAGADSPPAPYVKIYLMKDKKCISKWKTSTVVRTLDPLYQELFIFRQDYAHCILQVIVWGYYGKKDKKSLMGVAQIHLNDVDISNLVIGWYKLFNAPSMTNSLHSSKNLRKMLTKNLTIAN